MTMSALCVGVRIPTMLGLGGGQLLQVKEERDAIKAEMDRFYALPNPCGVGMGLDLTVRELQGVRTEVRGGERVCERESESVRER